MKQSIQESISQFILKLIISTVIYFKLSIFQKHHAQERVYKVQKAKKKMRKSEETLSGYNESPVAALPTI